MHLKPLWGGLPMPGDSRSSSVTVGEFRNHPFATFHSQESFGIMSQYVVDEISFSGPKMHYFKTIYFRVLFNK